MESKKYILKKINGEIICSKMKIAESFTERLKGLMFSEELPECDGFLINPCRSIHTFFMLYAIDVVFINKRLQVVKVIKNIKPWNITAIYFRADRVLEMKSGMLKDNLQAGDQLEAVCIN